MPSSRRPRPAWVDFVNLIWLVPLFSLPFAAFFLLMNRGTWHDFPGYFLVAMVFASAIALAQTIAKHSIDAAIQRRFAGEARMAWWIGGIRLVMGMVGAAAAMVVLQQTLMPGIFVHARDIVVALVFSTIFGALFLGIALAMAFYKKAVQHAGSERELQLARRIQRSFLLSEFPQRPRLDVHAVNVSSKEVSGDFYDVVPTGDNGILLAIADVSGKGVPAALLSSMIQASLRTQSGAVASPAAMIQTINTLACQRDTTGQFATFFLASVHEPTMTLRFSNAGHNFPALLRADGGLLWLKTGGIPIGFMEGQTYEEEVLTLGVGDRLLLYTDGVTEATDASGDMFGEERLEELLGALSRSLSAEGMVEQVLAQVRDFLGETEPNDDITVMAVRVLDRG